MLRKCRIFSQRLLNADTIKDCRIHRVHCTSTLTLVRISPPPPPSTPTLSPGCNVSPSPTNVSPTKNSWMLHPLDKVSLGYFAPDKTIPSLSSDLLERSDTRLPTATRGGVLCVGRACIRQRGASPINLVRGVGEACQTPH